MLIYLLIFLVPALFGIAAVSALQLLKERMAVALTGTIAGLAIATTLTYVLDIIMPMFAAVLAVVILLGAATVALAVKTKAKTHWGSLPFDKYAAGILVILVALFSIIAPKLLIADNTGLSTGIINAYGDIAWHMSNITAFAQEQSLPPENPIFSGTRLTYPFLSNFFSAMLMVGGASYAMGVNLPAVILIPLLLTLFYVLAREYTNSKQAAIIALLLFLFGGATLGWIRIGEDLAASNMPVFDFLAHLPDRDYSGVGTDKDGFHFLNPVTSLLLPQRSFLFGMPIAFSILLLLASATKKDDRPYIAAGILAGLLPLFHAHTVLVLIPAIIALFIIRPGQQWLLFILPAGIIGLPEVLYYFRGQNEDDSFLRWGPGWMSEGIPFVWYWIKNTGLLIPVAFAGLFLPAPKKLKGLTITAFILFAMGNLFLFAPWAWDNFKILVFWLLFSIPMIGWLAVHIIKEHPQWFVKVAVGMFIALHLASAGLDIWKLAIPTSAAWNEWSPESIAMAEQIQKNTLSTDAILTAPIHNSSVVLAGRSRYLGYAAHVWSHGGNPWERELAIKEFYEGRLAVLPETTVQYVLVGPSEKSMYPNLVIQPTWELVVQENSHSLYRLPYIAAN